MNAPAPIYLDYAATSALRPPEVIEAVTRYLRDVGATPGRAGQRRAIDAGAISFRCRRALANLFNIPGDIGRIAFQQNATHAINTALQGTLRAGDRVVRTQLDHNAVRRPAAMLARRGVEVEVVAGQRDGSIDLGELDAALAGTNSPARLLVVTHASNVLGSVLPGVGMAELAHERGAVVLLDAAQSAGHLPVDVDMMGIDLLAFTGHKGLLGPQGIGGLWIRQGVAVEPLIYGGTGGNSEAETMPATLPESLEAGTQNGPAIAGLLAGVEWLLERGVDEIHDLEVGLKMRLLEKLGKLPRVRVRSPAAPEGVGIVTLTVDGFTPAEVATQLDREHGVLTRAGLHCAPEGHAVLGTLESGGLRLSLGWASNETDVDCAVTALAAVCGHETEV